MKYIVETVGLHGRLNHMNDIIAYITILIAVIFGSAVGVTIERIRIRKWLKKIEPKTFELMQRNKVI